MLEHLIRLCDELINTKPNKDYYLLIKKILNTDNAFLKMNIETSYSILRDLGIEERNLRRTYLELIEP